MNRSSDALAEKSQFSELRQKAKAILNKLEASRFNNDSFDYNRLLEELNVYHIELELQHEELKKNRDKLEQSQKYLDKLYAYAPVGYVVMDIDGKILDVNEKAASYFQVERKIFTGQRLQSFIPHQSLHDYHRCFTQLLENNIPQHSEVLFRVHSSRSFWARIDMFQIKKSEVFDNLILCSILDISTEKHFEQELIELNQNLEKMVEIRTEELWAANKALKEEVKEREQAEAEARKFAETQKTLVREVNHRVKNNMQIMTSLMKLQANQTTHPDALEAIQESQNRIKALAMIHESLYLSQDLASIEFKQYLKKLIRHITAAYDVSRQGIEIINHSTIPTLHIDQALPMGLVLTELVTNSIKYAFPGDSRGEIGIFAQDLEDKKVKLIVKDNGIGIPENINLVMPDRLGLRLVQRIVVDQLNGEINIKRKDGTEIIVIFPKK